MRKKLHKVCFIFLVLVLISRTSFGKMKVGVVEFEERNPIGLDGASKIIAELTAENIVNIGKYEVAERVLLAKVLEEQELGISGIVDTKTAPEIGKVYGLEALVTGSYMKVGDEITINARMLDTKTGEVLSASTVKFTKLDALQANVEIIANELCGIKRDKLKVMKEEKKIKMTRTGVLLGGGYASDDDGYNSFAYRVAFFYNSRIFNIEITGAPTGNQTGICFIGGVNINKIFGLNIGYNSMYGDFNNYDYNGNLSNLEYDKDGWFYFKRGEVNTLLFGIRLRPSHRIVANINMGGIIGGAFDRRAIQRIGSSAPYNYNDNHYDDQKITSGFINDFPGSNWSISFDYFFNDTMGLRLFYLGAGAESKYIEPNKTSMNYYEMKFIGLMFSYSFTFGGW